MGPGSRDLDHNKQVGLLTNHGPGGLIMDYIIRDTDNKDFHLITCDSVQYIVSSH